MFTTKAFIVPQLNMLMCGTGMGGFLGRWFIVVNDRMIVKDIDNLDLLGMLVLGMPRYFRLVTRGVGTQGTVVALEPESRGSVSYRYQVDGRIYGGVGRGSDMSTRVNELRAEQSVDIFYDPQNKEVSCLGEPGKYFYSRLMGTAFIAALPTFFLLVLKVRRTLGLPPPIIRLRKAK